MIGKLTYWSVYVAIYYFLWAIVGLPFSWFIFIILIGSFYLIFKEKNGFYLRFLAYIVILISLFSKGTNDEQISALFCRLFIVVLGFLGLGIEYVYQLGNSDKTKEDAKKDFKVILGVCPNCLKKISRFSSKCPYCTADL
jgi:hypothetical protein